MFAKLSQRLRQSVSRLRRRWYDLARWQRVTSAAIAGVVLLSAIIPTVQYAIIASLYKLDGTTHSLIGDINKNLVSKISYDQEKSAWTFNASGQGADQGSAEAPALQAQAGGGGKDDKSLYSTDFPKDPSKGVKYYDSQTGLSFTMTPEFQLHEGRDIDGRLVYPAAKGAKVIYTAKNNGMKEDIVLTKFIGKELSYTYRLNLPNTLTAKIQEDGSVGVFSADPTLFGTISTGSDMDAAKLKSAREDGEKNHLLFAIPAPIVTQHGGKKAKATATFGIDGDKLTVTARDMDTVSYPASIDPSVVVTSSSDFLPGNNEGNIAYNTDQINRGNITGGSITNNWTTTGSGTYGTARVVSGSTIYNGYAYVLGGNISAGTSSEVNYAPINSDGTMGAWAATTALPAGRAYPGVAAFNGRMYVYGGYSLGSAALNTVYYATINSDGSLGSWTQASNNMAIASCRFGWTMANGYLYAVGGAVSTVASSCGNSSATNTNTLQYAQILANGDVGTWTTSPNTFTTARKDPGFAIYNGFAYLTSGTLDGTTTYRDTQIARVKSDGSIGSWRTSTQQTNNGKYRFGYKAYNGYLYLSGGTNNLTTTYYAQIYTNGDIGAWTLAPGVMTTGRYGHAFNIYKGYMYYWGGADSTYYSDAGYTKIDPPGTAGTSVATTSFGAALDSGTGGVGFMYNGYLYYAGGYNGTDYTKQVRYVAINADGTVGTWATTSALQTPITGGSGIGGQSYAIYNNRVYMIGGVTTVSSTATGVDTIQYATFNTNGTLSAWAFNPTNYVNTVYNQAAVAYNGYVYSSGFSSGGATNRVYRAPVNSDGTLGSWTWDGGGANNLPTSVSYGTMVTNNKFVYIVGGYNGGTYLNVVEYAAINSDGSLGTWATTNSLPTARNTLSVTILNGYMYAIGGETAASTYSSVVEFAKINTDGTVGTWQTSTALSTTYSAGGVATWNDNIYLISGRSNGTRGKTVYYLKTRSGGGGASGAWTVSGNTFTTGRQSHGMVVYNGNLYVLGGTDATSTSLSDVQFAALGDDGSIGAWATTTSLPGLRASMGTVVYGGYIYVFGGKSTSSSILKSSYSAKINSDGTLGSWNQLADLPDQLSSMGAVERNGYIYLLGGVKAVANNTVQYAKLSGGGAVGTWGTTTAFTGARYSSAVASNGNTIYIMGGTDGSGGYYKDVQYATLNSSDGTVSSWTYTTDLNYARAYMSAVIQNGNLYVYGGYDGTTTYNKVEYAPINANGSIGAWTASTVFTNSRYGFKADIYNGYMYITGGYGGGTFYNNAQSAVVQSSPRVGSYSKMFDLGSLYALTGVTYNGVLPGGTSSMTYQTAGSNGILTSPNPVNYLGATASVCGGGDVRYVFVNITIDDTSRSTLADENGSSSYVTDLSVNYTSSRAPVEKRLAHGKYFNNELLKPLETCTSS